jgi:hypothetical protein
MIIICTTLEEVLYTLKGDVNIQRKGFSFASLEEAIDTQRIYGILDRMHLIIQGGLDHSFDEENFRFCGQKIH